MPSCSCTRTCIRSYAAITPLPSMHGDGSYSLAVGACGDSTAGARAGAVYLLGLDAGGRVLAPPIKIVQGASGFSNPTPRAASFGSALAVLASPSGAGGAFLPLAPPGSTQGRGELIVGSPEPHTTHAQCPQVPSAFRVHVIRM